MSVIAVYHGSDVEVRQPEIRRSNRALDFGAGFYTTLNPDQARIRPLYNQLTFVTDAALSFLAFERSFIVRGGG